MILALRMRFGSFWILAGLVVLTPFGLRATVAAEDVYFVQRQVSSVTRGGRGPNAGTADRAALKTPGAALNRVTRTDSAGGAPKVLFETDRTIMGLSESLDGTRIV